MSGDIQGFVTREMCAHTTAEMLAGQKQIHETLGNIERRLFRDNGTLSIQTRIEKHEQILQGLLWAVSIVLGTILTSGVLGAIFAFKWVLAHGVAT